MSNLYINVQSADSTAYHNAHLPEDNICIKYITVKFV